MKKIILMLLFTLLVSQIAYAHGEKDFAEAEEIIIRKIPCSQLTDNQLELIGDYYIEQMHPGETHEIMDKIIGGEGSSQLSRMHINMARSFYCGEHQLMSGNMMNMMMGRTQGGMMNMIGGSGIIGYGGYLWFYQILIWILLIGLIILVYLWIWKLWKGLKSKR